MSSQAPQDQDPVRAASEYVVISMIQAARLSKRGACAGAASYLDEYSAGMPECDYWSKEAPRQTAKEWANQAHQGELEAFLFAAINELGDSPMTKKQIKRMIASLFVRMDNNDRTAFLGWAEQQK